MGESKQDSATCLNIDPEPHKIMLVFHRLFIHNKPVMEWWVGSFRIMGDGVRLNGSGV
jgi:hypothetical protein